jgi:hypothetical protein
MIHVMQYLHLHQSRGDVCGGDGDGGDGGDDGVLLATFNLCNFRVAVGGHHMTSILSSG